MRQVNLPGCSGRGRSIHLDVMSETGQIHLDVEGTASQFTWMYRARQVKSPGCSRHVMSIHLDVRVAGEVC